MTGPGPAPEQDVDPTVLGSLASRLGDAAPAFLDRLLGTWESETDRRMADLATAVAAGDAEAVGRAAHGVKGGSASMGAVRLAAVCGEVEQAVEQGAGRGADLPAVQVRLAAEVERARDALGALYRA